MFGKGRLRLWEIRKMTPPEICLALDDDIESPRAAPGEQVASAPMSHEDRIAWAQRRREMTAADRLAEVRQLYE